MQTNFDPEFLAQPQGVRANEIIRSCVHCGFCNATCPTYQITGDELDGPRGRIYLIRELLESGDNESRATQHLDRCLTCRACETTCPSGVQYGELVEIARNQLGPSRRGTAGYLRNLLAWMVPEAGRLRAMSRLGRLFKWMMPRRLAKLVPNRIGRGVSEATEGDKIVLLLNGCAQQVATPATNVALQKLLPKYNVGIRVLESEGCCGSLDLHAGDDARAKERIISNINAIMPMLPELHAIVSSASGCGLTMKEWGRVFKDDPDYAEQAAAISKKVIDASELMEELAQDQTVVLEKDPEITKVAWHAPCTLQHGQQVTDVVEPLLIAAGYELVPVADAHLCCGSAGTYSALQPKLSEELAKRKLAALQHHQPEVIASANVGCQSHLANSSSVPVVHWIELLR